MGFLPGFYDGAIGPQYERDDQRACSRAFGF